ncbi:leucine-rich repeat domain-containing protein [Candidatus Bipolaricaulota bacterium]
MRSRAVATSKNVSTRLPTDASEPRNRIGCPAWLAVVTVLVLVICPLSSNGDQSSGAPLFPDKALEMAVRAELGKPTGEILESDLRRIDGLIANGLGIEDLSGIEQCHSLAFLELRDNRIGDLSPLSELATMHRLSLPGNNVTDLGPLSGLRNLDSLDLSGNLVDDVSPLSALRDLTYLDLGGNRIVEIDGLSTCRNLRFLDLPDNDVENLLPLERLTRLETLNLSSNAVTDISPLAGLLQLKVLDLSGNAVSDLSPLAPLGELRDLSLSDNSLKDIRALALLQRISALDLRRNQISDIAPLSDMLDLRTLDLSSNLLEDVSALAGLLRLRSLWLDSNNIGDLSALSHLMDLRELYLGNNRVSVIAPLANLGNLSRLDLRSNQIADVEVIAKLGNLGWLELYHNDIVDISPLVRNGSLGEGAFVGLLDNRLSLDGGSQAYQDVVILQDRGVTLIFEGQRPPRTHQGEPVTLELNAGESIQSALDSAPSGSTLILGPGEWSESLRISWPVSIQASSSGETWILAPVPDAPAILVRGDETSPEVTLSGVNVDGGVSVAGQSSLGVRDCVVRGGVVVLADDAHGQFADVVFEQASLVAAGRSTLLIEDCSVFEPGTTGIALHGEATATLLDTSIHGAQTSGVSAEMDSTLVMRDCVIMDSGMDGLNLVWHSTATLEGITVDGAVIGVTILQDARLHAVDLSISNCSLNCVRVAYNAHAALEESDLVGGGRATDAAAIAVLNSADISLRSCTISNPSDNGIGLTISGEGSGVAHQSSFQSSGGYGLEARDGGALELIGCSLVGNRYGGANCFDAAALSIEDSTVSGNHVGLFISGNTTAEIRDSQLQMHDWAAVLLEGSANVAITACAFAGNAVGVWLSLQYGSENSQFLDVIGNRFRDSLECDILLDLGRLGSPDSGDETIVEFTGRVAGYGNTTDSGTRPLRTPSQYDWCVAPGSSHSGFLWEEVVPGSGYVPYISGRIATLRAIAPDATFTYQGRATVADTAYDVYSVAQSLALVGPDLTVPLDANLESVLSARALEDHWSDVLRLSADTRASAARIKSIAQPIYDAADPLADWLEQNEDSTLLRLALTTALLDFDYVQLAVEETAQIAELLCTGVDPVVDATARLITVCSCDADQIGCNLDVVVEAKELVEAVGQDLKRFSSDVRSTYTSQVDHVVELARFIVENSDMFPYVDEFARGILELHEMIEGQLALLDQNASAWEEIATQAGIVGREQYSWSVSLLTKHSYSLTEEADDIQQTLFQVSHLLGLSDDAATLPGHIGSEGRSSDAYATYSAARRARDESLVQLRLLLIGEVEDLAKRVTQASRLAHRASVRPFASKAALRDTARRLEEQMTRARMEIGSERTRDAAESIILLCQDMDAATNLARRSLLRSNVLLGLVIAVGVATVLGPAAWVWRRRKKH